MIRKIKEKIRWMLYHGLYKPGHYYSTVPDLKQVMQNEKVIFGQQGEAGIDLRERAQLLLLNDLVKFQPEYPWKKEPLSDLRYYSNNTFFNEADAFALYGLMRLLRPKNIIEIGSGFSSAVMLDTNENFLDSSVNITFVEPFPDRLNTLVRGSDMTKFKYNFVTEFVQNTSPGIYTRLAANDILFIDSSHVSKVGSDLNHIMFNILPNLQKGVYIHFHDIFYPLEYPKDWLQQGIYWNEIYLLKAFLMFNNHFEIVLFNSLWNQRNIPGLEAYKNGGSIWLRKIQ